MITELAPLVDHLVGRKLPQAFPICQEPRRHEDPESVPTRSSLCGNQVGARQRSWTPNPPATPPTDRVARRPGRSRHARPRTTPVGHQRPPRRAPQQVPATLRASELGIVSAQALSALWFYRLCGGVDTVVAGAFTAFGMVNGRPMCRPEQPGAAGETGEAVAS